MCDWTRAGASYTDTITIGSNNAGGTKCVSYSAQSGLYMTTVSLQSRSLTQTFFWSAGATWNDGNFNDNQYPDRFRYVVTFPVDARTMQICVTRTDDVSGTNSYNLLWGQVITLPLIYDACAANQIYRNPTSVSAPSSAATCTACPMGSYCPFTANVGAGLFPLYTNAATAGINQTNCAWQSFPTDAVTLTVSSLYSTRVFTTSSPQTWSDGKFNTDTSHRSCGFLCRTVVSACVCNAVGGL